MGMILDIEIASSHSSTGLSSASEQIIMSGYTVHLEPVEGLTMNGRPVRPEPVEG